MEEVANIATQETVNRIKAIKSVETASQTNEGLHLYQFQHRKDVIPGFAIGMCDSTMSKSSFSDIGPEWKSINNRCKMISLSLSRYLFN